MLILSVIIEFILVSIVASWPYLPTWILSRDKHTSFLAGASWDQAWNVFLTPTPGSSEHLPATRGRKTPLASPWSTDGHTRGIFHSGKSRRRTTILYLTRRIAILYITRIISHLPDVNFTNIFRCQNVAAFVHINFDAFYENCIWHNCTKVWSLRQKL